jgi:hypothetical protein
MKFIKNQIILTATTSPAQTYNPNPGKSLEVSRISRNSGEDLKDFLDLQDLQMFKSSPQIIVLDSTNNSEL